jgi:uncharacterized protein YjbJ (UPF0337 family)
MDSTIQSQYSDRESTMISKERLDGNWNRVTGAVREKFAQITGDDLERVQGNAEQLIGMIQQKTGVGREKIESFLDSCCRSTESAVNRVTDTASEYAGMAGKAVRENYDQFAADAQRGYTATMKSMRRRPLESVAIALGAGVLAGIAVGLAISKRSS